MDKKEIEQQTQPAPTQDNAENAILKMLQKMDSRLSELEDNIKQPAKPAPIPQDSLRFYDSKPIAKEEFINETSIGPANLKTYGEFRQEASQMIQKERQEFLFNQQFGSALTKARSFGRNETHLEECAILGIYDNSDSRFKEIIKDKIELLRNCDYIGLAETAMAEEERSKIIHKTLFSSEIPLFDEKHEILKNQVIQIAASRL